MLKSIKKLLLPLLFLSCLTSCTGKGPISNSKIQLDFGMVHDEDEEEVLTCINKVDADNHQIEAFIDHKDSDGNLFDSNRSVIIAVTYDFHCGCWGELKRRLTSYALKYDALIYYYDARGAEAQEIAHDLGIKNVSNAPLWLLIEKGKIVIQDIYSESKKRFLNDNVFEEYLNEQIKLPRMFYVNKTQLDEMYDGNKDFVIYFLRSSCYDCNYVNNNFLFKEMGKDTYKDKKMYVIDLDSKEINPTNDTQTDQTYLRFKEDYGLSNVKNPTFGYETGFVPTFFCITPHNGDKINSIKSGAVVQNDQIDNNNVITKSYFSEERSTVLDYLDNVSVKVLTGIKLSEGEKLNYAEQKEAFAKYFDPLLSAFLTKHL